MSNYAWAIGEPDTILRAALRRTMWHGLRARDEEIRLLVLHGGHGVRATAKRFGMTPQNITRIHQGRAS
jgi:hypothetical protein